MALDKDTALAIINEAKAGGYEDRPLPATDEEIIARGEYFYEEAKKAFHEANIRDNSVQTIIFLGDSTEMGNVHGSYPRRSSGGLSESDERETDVEVENGWSSFLRKENLPIPHQIEGDAVPMPRDLSELSDKEVRRLSGEYNAYLARVTYLLGVELSDLASAQYLLDAAHSAAMRNINVMGPDKKQKLAKVIESEIAIDPEVIKYSGAVNAHQKQVTTLKALKEIYSGNVDRLSREWTMRQNEWEKSR